MCVNKSVKVCESGSESVGVQRDLDTAGGAVHDTQSQTVKIGKPPRYYRNLRSCARSCGRRPLQHNHNAAASESNS